jgi:hypothetical protein
MYKVHNNTDSPIDLLILGDKDVYATLPAQETIAIPPALLVRGFRFKGVTYKCSPIYDTEEFLEKTLEIPALIEGKYILVHEKEQNIDILFTRL